MKNSFMKFVKYALTLAIVTSLASGSLAYTYSVTKEKIEKMKIAEQVEAVKRVCGKVAKGAEIKPDTEGFKKVSKSISILKAVYRVEKEGKTVAYGILTSPRGYGGPMNVMVGIDSKGSVLGVKVVDHRETPGLGDKVTDSQSFLSQFKGKQVSDPVEVKEDIDAVSGATISSKGITMGVRAALDAFKQLGDR